MAGLSISVLLSIAAWALFVLLWASTWLGRFLHIATGAFPVDLFFGAAYFAVCPGLAILSILFSAIDLARRHPRGQAVSACLASGLLLSWLWLHPPR
jgi:hypothetical protein